jgi:hypothetical protein
MDCHGFIGTVKIGIFFCHAGKQAAIFCRDQVMAVGHCPRKNLPDSAVTPREQLICRLFDHIGMGWHGNWKQ